MEREVDKTDASALGLVKDGVQSALYAGFQQPLTGLTQLVGLKMPTLVDAPKPAEFGSNAWYAQTIGAGFGMVAPFLATQRTTSALLRTKGTSLAKTAFDGAVYGMVLTPSEDPTKGFWEQRAINSATLGMTFGTQAGATRGMMAGWNKLGMPTKNIGLRIGTNMGGGALAGAMYAESNSLLSGQGHATAEQFKQSIASFIVTGGALDAVHIAAGKMAKKPATVEKAENTLPEEHVPEFRSLTKALSGRRTETASPKEVEMAAEAVDRLLAAKHLEVPLTQPQRIDLAKQLLQKAAEPKSVEAGRDPTAGPAAVLMMAQYTNPGKHAAAIVDLVTTGKTVTESGTEINLSRAHLRQIDKALGTSRYENALMPDGSPNYADQLGMMLYGNVHSQVLRPEGQRGTYVGDGIFQVRGRGKVDLLETGLRLESRDLQPMHREVTGGTPENFLLLNTREPLQPHEGTAVLSARELEMKLLSSERPFLLDVGNGGKRNVVMAEPAIDAAKGRPYTREDQPLFNLIDTFGTANNRIGKDGLTATELFDMMRQPYESPRIEVPRELEGIANVGEVDPAGLFRGRKPKSFDGIMALKEKGTTLIIDLIQGPVMEPGNTGRTREQAWAEEAGIKYINIKTSVKNFDAESVQKVFEAIEAELFPTDGRPPGKVFMHCARGSDRTGTIAALWRLTHQQGWDSRLAMAEMRQFGWNGNTPSTQRMGALVANPQAFDVAPVQPQLIGFEPREIAKRQD